MPRTARRKGLTWEEMAEVDRQRLRDGMKLTAGERVAKAIAVSKLATRARSALTRRP